MNRAAVPLPLDITEAQRHVRAGSAIVVIPYTSVMEPDGAIHLSTYTEMAAQAAASLYTTAHDTNTQVVAIGEHTYGPQTVATTDLIYDSLLRHGVPAQACAAERPMRADATPQQIAWLAEVFGDIWHGQPPVLVGHKLHWPRIARLCALYKMRANFIDASEILRAAGSMTPAYRRAVALYETQGLAYERQTQRLTDLASWLGPAAITALFRALVRLRSPNVLEVHGAGDTARLYAVTARQHIRNIRRQ